MLIGGISSRVRELGRLPVGGGRTKAYAVGPKEEVVVKVTDTTEVEGVRCDRC